MIPDSSVAWARILRMTLVVTDLVPLRDYIDQRFVDHAELIEAHVEAAQRRIAGLEDRITRISATVFMIVGGLLLASIVIPIALWVATRQFPS